jgi:uncharacterized damage-inducible protein DinB
MRLNEVLLQEFDREMSSTRKTLERLPEDKLEWRPHEKSFKMGDLATHLANIPTWIGYTMEQDSMDMHPPGAPAPRATPAGSRAELLARFDKNVSAARGTLAGARDEQLGKPWTLLVGGKEIFTQPKIAVLRSFVMNHSIHHRAQLGVYLRLNDVPVPAIYGPTADEGM